jgi:NADH:ubiquinone oxidoreductase subunit E
MNTNLKQEISDNLIEILQDIQAEFGYLPEDIMRKVSKDKAIPLIEVFRVANFYKAFTLEPRGKYLITVCLGTACHVRGASRIIDEVLRELNVKAGGTTEDGLFTVEGVNCVGACALGPVVIINGVYYDHMNPSKLRELVASLREKERA